MLTLAAAAALALTPGACATPPRHLGHDDCISDFNPDTDYFPDKSTVLDASNFTLSYHGSYQVLTVAQPYPGGRPESYVLLRCGAAGQRRHRVDRGADRRGGAGTQPPRVGPGVMSLQLVDLAVGYRHRRRSTTVAAGLRAVARRGELTALLGPNGCGKSTLIRTLCGLQPPLSGQVLLDGIDLSGLAPAESARRVAVVLTDRIDPGLLSARELAGLGRIPHLGLSARLRPDDDAVVDWALAAVHAGHLAARPAAELSDGERQRVLTARALAQQPQLLVLDEPTAFLDVPSRAGLVELLRGLARDQQLTVLMSTHDLELALRVADRVWLLHPGGTLVDAVPEDLMLSGRIGDLFDGDTLRFDPASGTFAFLSGTARRSARIEAPEPLRVALDRVLAREGWHRHEPAEIVLTATEPDAITVRTGGRSVAATLSALPALLRELPAGTRRVVPESAGVLADVSQIGRYFAVSSGPAEDGWRPVRQLYTDTELLDGVIDRLAARIGTAERRVAASTFHLGYAARLWSIGLGALARHSVLVDFDRLLFSETDGQITLRLPQPICWRGDDLEPALADSVLDDHLTPLAAAVRRLTPLPEKLLWGNAVSALLGAGRVLNRDQLARTLCADERLSGAVCFDTHTGYRRLSCCLYYRTPDGGLCGDCALTTTPTRREATR